MHASIITISCRKEPRFADMARSIVDSLGNALKAGKDISLDWVIVDELDRPKEEFTAIHKILKSSEDAIINLRVVPPLPSAAREARLPAHNSARNAGLRFIGDSDYVVFLNDCTVVTSNWVSTLNDMAAMAIGWKCHQVTMVDLKMDKPIVNGVTSDHQLRSVPPATVGKSVCWGAPRKAWMEIAGFDLAYDGQSYGHDIEAAVRLTRVGVKFHTSFRAVAVRLSRTAAKASPDKAAALAVENRKRLNDLMRKRDRILPEVSPTDAAKKERGEKRGEKRGGGEKKPKEGARAPAGAAAEQKVEAKPQLAPLPPPDESEIDENEPELDPDIDLDGESNDPQVS